MAAKAWRMQACEHASLSIVLKAYGEAHDLPRERSYLQHSQLPETAVQDPPLPFLPLTGWASPYARGLCFGLSYRKEYPQQFLEHARMLAC